MTVPSQGIPEFELDAAEAGRTQAAARDHLGMHFTRMST